MNRNFLVTLDVKSQPTGGVTGRSPSISAPTICSISASTFIITHILNTYKNVASHTMQTAQP